MAKSTVAGAAYFLIVFLLGFGLGTIRVLLVAPCLGETMAVLLETPLMLAASWASCGWCLRWFEVAPKADARAVMGGVAFALLMAAELAVSVLLFGQTASSAPIERRRARSASLPKWRSGSCRSCALALVQDGGSNPRCRCSRAKPWGAPVNRHEYFIPGSRSMTPRHLRAGRAMVGTRAPWFW